ncbi:MAG: hypothetical protein AB7J40_02595 [Candidatus Altimarinota bacterium]
MKTRKVAISIPTNLLEMIDKLAKELNISRSSILSEGASLIAKQYQQIAIAKGYEKFFSKKKNQEEGRKTAEMWLKVSSLPEKW